MPTHQHAITHSQHRYRISLPQTHLSLAGFAIGDTITVSAEHISGRLCIVLTGDGSSGVATEIQSPRSDSTQLGVVAIPSTLVEAGRLSGAQVRYSTSPNQIIAIADHTPQITGHLTLKKSKEKLLTGRQKYPVQFSAEMTESVGLEDTVWIWLDTHTNGFVICVDVTKENAPETAVSRVVSHTHTSAAEHTIRIPKKLVKAVNLSGTRIKWGHDSTRLMGVIEG